MPLEQTEAAPIEPQAPAATTARPWRTRLGAPLLTVVLVAAFSATVVGVAVPRHHQLFVLDEATYADYLIKVHGGEWWMPRGDRYDQEALRIVSCRGIGPGDEVRGPVGDCSVRARDGADLNGGISTAAIHPPTYFIVTDIGARVVLAVGVTEDLVTAGRLAGAAWMAAGLLLLIVLARELGASRAAVVLLTVTIGLSQRLVEEWQYLTPDAANVVVGSGVVLVGVRWLRGRAPRWALGAAGVAAVFLKSPNVLVVGATAAAILVASEVGRSLRERIVAAATLAGGSVVGAGVIAVIMALRAETGFQSPQDRAQHVPSLTADHFLNNLDAFVTPLVRDGRGAGLAQLVFVLVLGLVVAAAFQLPGRDIRQPLAAGLLFTVAVGPAVLVLLVFVAQHQYADIPERYGFSLLPGIAAVASTFWTTGIRLAAVASIVVPYAVLGATRLL